MLQRSAPDRDGNQTRGGGGRVTHGERNPLTNKRKNNRRRISRQQGAVSLRVRFAKDEWRSTHWIAQWLPSQTALAQSGMARKDVRQGAGNISAYHGASVHTSVS